jgi:hypothetical protein
MTVQRKKERQKRSWDPKTKNMRRLDEKTGRFVLLFSLVFCISIQTTIQMAKHLLSQTSIHIHSHSPVSLTVSQPNLTQRKQTYFLTFDI